jgi:transcriptional regulator with XRE-family HTH domain
MGNLRDTIANRIREIRNEKGLSQEYLSEEAGYSRTYVGQIERGKKNPTVDAIEKIADVLDVEPWKLLKDK